ncbi:MAG: hypothetical protein LBD75_00285 [Candidatus Peribacteria bacterium]|jgi:hypothetical protein|nr:hypothetical protein [Candidatus Peribacteria bacterium]
MRKQYLLKTFLCIAMLAIVGFDVLFAAGEVTTNADQNIADLALIINFFLNILSWARIIFAHIAGSLLTNTWVYGEAIGFDTALWVCRNMIKNISNFLL